MIKYSEEIKESEESLREAERRASWGKGRDRIRMLRWLKSGECRSLPEVAKRIGLSEGYVRRLYERYRRGGKEALVRRRTGSNREKLTPQQTEALVKRSRDGFESQRAVTDYLKQTFKAHYTQGGVSLLLKRLKIKLKTARPRHQQKDEAAADAFKKNLHPRSPISLSISLTR
jgi:transposase